MSDFRPILPESACAIVARKSRTSARFFALCPHCVRSLPAGFVTSSSAFAVNRASFSAVFAPISNAADVDTAPLALGIGCRRGVTLAQVEAAVQAALDDRPIAHVIAVGTIDTKADEPALRDFCAAHALTLAIFTREQIATMPALSPSLAALAHQGVDGVCEPCARLAANGGPLVRGKLALEGVTVAIAIAVTTTGALT